MTTKTIKFTDLPPLYSGNKAGVAIIDDVYPALPDAILYDELGNATMVDLKTVEMMSNEQIDQYVEAYSPWFHADYSKIEDYIVATSANYVHTFDQAQRNRQPPLPKIWNQKKKYTVTDQKYAKAIRKRDKDKANRRRARHAK